MHGDPGSLSLGLQPDVVFAGRTQAQREFCPGQIVYARGQRWKVKGLALSRPGALGTGRGPEEFRYTECPVCGLAQESNNNCRRCGNELSGSNNIAWDAATFQAWPEELEPGSEEERSQGVYDVRPHPQRDVIARTWSLGPWVLETRQQEQIWWMNHGRFDSANRAANGRNAPRVEVFRLCPSCGEFVRPPAPPPDQVRRGRRPARDPRANQDPHAQKCTGEPRNVVLGHQTRGDTLRIKVPSLEFQGSDGVSWAWSLGAALLQGALRCFQLDVDDLEVLVLTARDANGTPRTLEVVFVDKVLGGSGVIEAMAREFPAVAAATVRQLAGHDCPSSCYRCLRTYRNQRIQGLLNWRIVLPYLQAAAESEVTFQEPNAPQWTRNEAEWEAARREWCESPLELELLQEMRAAGLPEPLKQREIFDSDGRLITRADFAYDGLRRVLLYADGLEYHSSTRQRIQDTHQTNRLQADGWVVLRFLGPQIRRNPNACVNQIRSVIDEEGGPIQ